MLNLLVILILSYLLGSIPTSIIVSKLARGIDIRQHGSGNAGGTNVFRVLGWKYGVFVMVVDVFKGFVATFWIARLLPVPVSTELGQIFAGCAAIIGHIWTVFAGFRGGKGVGTAAGMLVALYPVVFIICLAVFALAVLTTRIVSVASMSAAVALPLTLSVLKFMLHKNVPGPLYVFSFIAMALIIFTHRSNIKRLLNGTENRFGKKKPVQPS
jgi:acyl phosphate:glycerol-3-phosphate acyltransferase